MSEIRGKKGVYIADDIAVLAEDEERMKGIMGKLERYLDEIELGWNGKDENYKM